MAVHKVPQDVEADDKLLGPFSFRQFIYLLIVAALIALAWALGQIFPLFAILPIPPAIFLLILALPLRKDQPMETYIAALISFYTKPNARYWFPGQRESTIEIIAPKIVEKNLTRDITEEEAGRRLSFLANVVDSEGYSIKDGFTPQASTTVRDEFVAEAEAAPDIFENYQSTQVAEGLSTEADRHRAEVIQQMRAAIAANNPIQNEQPPAPEPPMPNFNPANLAAPAPAFNPATLATTPTPNNQTISAAKAINPTQIPTDSLPSNPLAQTVNIPQTQPQPEPESPRSEEPTAHHDRLVALSKNKEFTVATIAKEAHRKSSRKNNGDEVYISLH